MSKLSVNPVFAKKAPPPPKKTTSNHNNKNTETFIASGLCKTQEKDIYGVKIKLGLENLCHIQQVATHYDKTMTRRIFTNTI